MEKTPLEIQLRALSVDKRAAVLLRVALRAMPLLLQKRFAGNPAADGNENKFWFWGKSDQKSHLLAIFRACSVGMVIAMKGEGVVGMQRVSAAAAAGARAAAAAADRSDAFVASAFARAVSCAVANSSADMVDDTLLRRFEVHVKADLHDLSIYSVSKLMETPLWKQAPPKRNSKKPAVSDSVPKDFEAGMHAFKAAVHALDQGFSIWLEWLEDRLQGLIRNLLDLEQWIDIPEEIEAQGTEAVNAYIRSVIYKQAAMPLNRVRTIFIGYGESGKTSLIRALHGEDVVLGKEKMTPGVAIREWGGLGNGVVTHFWDFGGQVIAHATHQFFLRASCLYVLVLSARAEVNGTEQAEYWLQHVKAFGDGAPVMLVCNKLDEVPVSLEMASLREKYPNIVDFYPLSCLHAKKGKYQNKFEHFKREFLDQLTELGMHQMMFTPEQFAVLKEVRTQSSRQALMERKQFDALCQEQGIGEDGVQNREWLLDILDKLGVVIHFKNIPYLGGYVLNPRWLTYGVYTIMYAGCAQLDDVILFELLSGKEILDENKQCLTYEPDKCFFIAKAMQEFKLCYLLHPDTSKMIVPCLLPTDIPGGLTKIEFDKNMALAFKIDFTGFVPRHVMPELIVARHEEIVKKLVWQYGAFLEDKEAKVKAMLQVDYQARELCIWVVGRAAREYLSGLRVDLKRILNRIKLRYRECIRLPHGAMTKQLSDPGEEDWVEYQQIENFIKMGMPEFISAQGAYDLSKVVGLYGFGSETSRVGTVNLHLGDVYNSNQVDARSNSITLNNSTVDGDLNAGDSINSHNTGNKAVDAGLSHVLEQILAAIGWLGIQAQPDQSAAVDTLRQQADRLDEECKRPEPRIILCEQMLSEIECGVANLGPVANRALEVLKRARNRILNERKFE